MKPEDANPKNFKVQKVVYKENTFSIAKGIFNNDGKLRFAMRWDGEEESDQGYPNYGKWPMWFQLPDDIKPILVALIENCNPMIL